jgi:hypothetical protein
MEDSSSDGDAEATKVCCTRGEETPCVFDYPEQHMYSELDGEYDGYPPALLTDVPQTQLVVKGTSVRRQDGTAVVPVRGSGRPDPACVTPPPPTAPPMSTSTWIESVATWSTPPSTTPSPTPDVPPPPTPPPTTPDVPPTTPTTQAPVPTSAAARIVMTAAVDDPSGGECTKAFAADFPRAFLNVLNESDTTSFPVRSRVVGLTGTSLAAPTATPARRRRLLQEATSTWDTEVAFNVTEVGDEAEIVLKLAREIEAVLAGSEPIEVVVDNKSYAIKGKVTSRTRSGLHRDHDDDPAWIEKDLSIALVTTVSCLAVAGIGFGAFMLWRTRHGRGSNQAAYHRLNF